MKPSTATAVVLLSLTIPFVSFGCGSSSSAPSAPTPNGNGLTIVFRNPTGSLAAVEDLITEHLQQTFDLASRELSLAGLVVEVTAGPDFIVPGWGVGGKAFGRQRVEIAVDPTLSRQLIDERLPSLAAHEFHHIARGRGPGYGDTLLRAMVSEGMADHYAAELFGRPPPPWAVALPQGEIPGWIERARPEFDAQGYGHALWFFGAGSIPNWTGYTLGYELIGRYKATHPAASAAALVDADADLFRP